MNSNRVKSVIIGVGLMTLLYSVLSVILMGLGIISIGRWYTVSDLIEVSAVFFLLFQQLRFYIVRWYRMNETITEYMQVKYDESGQTLTVTIDTERVSIDGSYIPVLNDWNPKNWEDVTGLSSTGNNSVCFALQSREKYEGDELPTQDVDSVIYPKETYGIWNAVYDTPTDEITVTVYDQSASIVYQETLTEKQEDL